LGHEDDAPACQVCLKEIPRSEATVAQDGAPVAPPRSTPG